MDLLKALEVHLGDVVEESKEPLTDLLSKANATPGEKLAALKGTSVIHGFDIPRMLTLLMYPSVTGKLHLTDADGKASQHPCGA